MRKVVFITQVVDPDDPNLGATVAKIAALSRRVDEVVVVCDRGTAAALPANCRVRTFGAPTRPGRAVRYVRAVLAELRRPPVAVVAHMVPLYAVVAAPFVRARRIPLILWYTHWKAHVVLRLATLVCTDVASVDVRSFPLESRKLHAIGHGIDLDDLPCQPAPDSGGRPLRVLALGRYSPPKRLDELIEGVRIARERGLTVQIDLRGTASPGREAAYKQRVEEIAARPGYREFATVGGPVPRSDVPALYGSADLVASDFDSADKVVLEACASCRPVLASHAGFDRLLAGIEPPLAFDRGRPESFADRLEALAALSDEERHAIGKELRERVRAQHSVETWAEGILGLAR